MIYTLGLENGENVSDVNYILNYFNKHRIVQFDTETTGFDPHIEKLLCFQMGDRDNQFVIHPDYLLHFKDLLENKLLLGQNLKFDLKFLYKHNIFPKRVWDTFLAESIINCGIIKKKDLKSIAKERINVDLDKSIRDGLLTNKGSLSKEEIEYSANDVKWLEDIKNSQEHDIKKLQLQKAVLIDNSFVLCLAYIEFCGFKLNKDKWAQKCIKDLDNYNNSLKSLNDFVINNNHHTFINSQLDLFSTELSCKINWGSPKQVAEYFKFLKIPVKTDDGGESVGEKNIAKYQKDFPIISIYLEYKGYEKLIGTYGENFYRHINPVTGRIHTQFKQIMDTGRLSSGGKNRATKEEYINFQNIPSDKETRACFVAEEGNILLVSDYSGQEQVVLANNSEDENLLKFYDDGLADMHSYVASKMYKELEGLTLDEVKDKHKAKRQSAKSAGFAINYGGTGLTIAQNLNISVEEGDFIYNSYFEAFPGLKDYFKKVQTQALSDGYVLISKKTGRKCFIAGYEGYLKGKTRFNKRFWDNYRLLKEKESPAFPELKEEVSKWFKFKGQIERMALNYPIQGQSAEITKISCIYFFNWMRANNLFTIVKFVNTIHDENVIECPIEISEETSIALENAMNKAANLYCRRVKLTAVPEKTLYWKK
jgi:DNA polymerase-1